MASQTVTTTEYTDDLTGGKADGTVAFSFDGSAYEIDLSKANTRAFERALRPYIDAARKTRSSRAKGARGKSSAATQDLATVREWAKSNGYEVAERGRVAEAILEAYAGR
jgi:Lsr2